MRGRYVGGRRVLGVGSYGRSTLSATGQDTLAGADEADNPPSPHPPTHSTRTPPYPTLPIKNGKTRSQEECGIPKFKLTSLI